MKIGFIGLGLMGRGIAANLQKGGHALVVNDLTRQAASQHLENGATWAETPRAVAERMSTLSTPMPARPTTFRFSAASSSSFVTLVAERIARPS